VISNSIFVSLKRNIDGVDEQISEAAIKRGVPIPSFFNDFRLTRTVKERQLGVNPHRDEDEYVEIMQETNYLRDFGYGRKIGPYDLSAMVVGHNMSMRKELFIRVGGFSTEFKGWGLEDTYFGAVAITVGAFVIPVVSTGVYHINHPPRSGSESKKLEEFKMNIERYKVLIRQK
jgi:hypothetical protein